MAMLPPDFGASSNHIPLVSDGSAENEAKAKKREKEELEELTIRTQKVISDSISSLVRSGDQYIELEKEPTWIMQKLRI